MASSRPWIALVITVTLLSRRLYNNDVILGCGIGFVYMLRYLHRVLWNMILESHEIYPYGGHNHGGYIVVAPSGV